MSSQQSLFTGNNIATLNVYHAPAPRNESKTTTASVKLADTEKKVIQDFCLEHDVSFSAFVRDAALFYHSLYPESSKLTKYREAVVAMLNKLP